MAPFGYTFEPAPLYVAKKAKQEALLSLGRTSCYTFEN